MKLPDYTCGSIIDWSTRTIIIAVGMILFIKNKSIEYLTRNWYKQHLKICKSWVHHSFYLVGGSTPLRVPIINWEFLAYTFYTHYRLLLSQAFWIICRFFLIFSRVSPIFKSTRSSFTWFVQSSLTFSLHWERNTLNSISLSLAFSR